MALKDVLVAMDAIGFTDIILPFILVFTVVFATLQKTKVLGVDKDGKPKGNYNAMVAFVLAFFVLVMTRTLNVITWFTRYLALLLVVFVFLGILFSFLGVREHHKGTLMFVALMLLSAVFLEVLTFTGVIAEDVMNQLLLPVLAVVFLVGTAYFMLRKPEKPKPAEKGKPEEKKGEKVKAEAIPPGGEREL